MASIATSIQSVGSVVREPSTGQSDDAGAPIHSQGQFGYEVLGRVSGRDGDLEEKSQPEPDKTSKNSWFLGFCCAVFVITAGIAGFLLAGRLDQTCPEAAASTGSDDEISLGPPMAGFPETQPNIFVMLVDDLGMADTSFTGAEFETPNIDRLFEEGLRLSAIYGMPLCTPSRSAMLTGRFTYKLGLQQMEVIHADLVAGIPLEVKTLGDYLKEVGYSTHYFGRWALGHAAEAQRPLARGWDSYNGELSLLSTSFSNIVVNLTEDLGFSAPTMVLDWWDGSEPEPLSSRTDAESDDNDGWSASKIVDKLDELHETDGAWHIFWSSQLMHKDFEGNLPSHPRMPNTDIICAGSLRPMFCSWMVLLDFYIGEVVDKIKSNGDWDNTLFLLTTDNGGQQLYQPYGPDWAEQYYSSNWPFRGGKETFYEGGIRLITTVSGGWLPENLRGGTCDRRHHVADVTATFLAAARFKEIPSHLDGKNFFQDEHEKLVISIAPQTWTSWIAERMTPEQQGTCVMYGDWKYIAARPLSEILYPDYATGLLKFEHGGAVLLHNTTTGTGTIDECWEVDADGIFAKGCLFNIRTDPMELQNMWDERPEIIQSIQTTIKDELYGFEYKPGTQMERDERVFYDNLGGSSGSPNFIHAWIADPV